MTAIDDALGLVRSAAPLAGDGPAHRAMREAGIRFVALGGPLQARWEQAVEELEACIRPLSGSAPVLNEGGVYRGSWIESTGTINAELLSRFAPEVTTATHLLFAEHQRDDGMIPYKVTDAGPGFSQIQIVTPLARTVFNHYLLAGRDRDYLRTMYSAMVRFDGWLARYRDTRGTGAVEAFCTFDTGHDLSPRFWHVPDRCWHSDATRYDPASPILPFIAPDLTANVASQRAHLGLIAAELGDDPQPWVAAATASEAALWSQCFDETDGIFYDRDARGDLVRVPSDVLLRVLACDIGDGTFAAAALERYLMNTTKFLGHYGFTSLAMDDPRFDHDFTRNSWGGPSNFLSLIRAPHAFERHGRVAELAMTAMPVLAAVAGWDRFPQCLDPWSGTAGFTQMYSPSILWLLDALERYAGILPRPDGEVWFTGLAPTRLDHGAAATATGYARTVDGRVFELVGDDTETIVLRDGVELMRYPRGWRVVTDRTGRPTAIVGIAATPVSGDLVVSDPASGGTTITLTIEGNERVELAGTTVGARHRIGVIAPRF